MTPDDLGYDALNANILAPYEKRAKTVSGRFQRWFLENIFRTEPVTADDASVDKEQDKGVDGIFVDDIEETIFVIQTKVRKKDTSKIGDTDLKEFTGTLTQFQSSDSIDALLSGNSNIELKKLLRRERISDKVKAGYRVTGIFCTNAQANDDGEQYLYNVDNISFYGADEICDRFIDLDIQAGVEGSFDFDVRDTDVITYSTTAGHSAKFFLCPSLNLVHMQGIEDQSLFSQNVRLALGKTKVNKALRGSIGDKAEHVNFPLYHNGITVLCQKIVEENDQKITVQNYQVVNGAQSLTSLKALKSKLSDDLTILTRVIELGDDLELSEKITHNSNNQNAIKARDLKSNHPIQNRLKAEVALISNGNWAYEVKRGEVQKSGTRVISNEDAGLVLLALDVGEPWACHQKYKVMDDSHAKIFGRPSVDGAKIYALTQCLDATTEHLGSFEDQLFGHYTLTKYFLAFAVSEILKHTAEGRQIFGNFDKIIADKKLDDFVEIFSNLASTTADDLNAEVAEVSEDESFDYKRDLKSPVWTRKMLKKLQAQYKKDVKRKKAEPIEIALAQLL